MELKDFVKEALTNIVIGISESHAFMQENNFDGKICTRISSKWEETEYVYSEGEDLFKILKLD